jgi:hypothetical protein
MVEFRSRFQNDAQLKKAAEFDPEHVGEAFHREGNHVRLIKEALNAWAAKQTPTLAPLPVTNVFDKATGDRVALYKTRHEPPILNFQKKIDRVVGKQTVRALDLELPPLDEKPPVLQVVDIVVHYRGAANELPLFPGDVLPETLLIPYLQKHLVSADRVLHRFGQNTRKIREESAGMIASDVQKITNLVNGKDAGKICISGSSSGGRNALDLALAVTRRGLPLAYVGILDAAFFPNETRDVPTITTKPVPHFRMYASIQSDRHDNFFQTVGNHKKITRQGAGLLFTSEMGGEEIHGSVPPLRDRDFSNRILPSSSDDGAHGQTISGNIDEVRKTISKILNEA